MRPYQESVRYRDFMGWDVPWYSAQDSAGALLTGRAHFSLVCYLRHDRVFATYWTSGRGVEVMAPTYGLLDMTVPGRQETWKSRPPAGRNGGKSAASRSVPTGVPPRNGLAGKPDAPTTLTLTGAERRPAA